MILDFKWIYSFAANEYFYQCSHWWLTNGKLLKMTKMSDFSRIHVIQLFLVVFCDFQMHLTLRQIDRIFRFLSQIKAPFFYFNRLFVKYLLSSLRACRWLIISDYFSSIFPMLNSHKKSGFCSKKVSPSRFWLNTSVFVYVMTYQMRKTLSRSCAFKKNFYHFGVEISATFFEISSYTWKICTS